MKKLLAIILILTCLFSLSSCDKYSSSYRAVGLIKSNDRDSCSVSFFSLDGTISFNVRLKEGNEGMLDYKASLEEGKISVYYDIYGTKESLFALEAGESVDSSGGYIESGKRVHIIIEADGAKNGSVNVNAG